MLPGRAHSHGAAPAHRDSPMVLPARFASLQQPVFALWLMALLWIAIPAPAAAQAGGEPQEPQVLTRAALLEAARRAKTEAVEPPTRTGVERGLRRFRDGMESVGNIQKGWKGFHFATGDFPAGAGFSYGLGFTDRAVCSRFEEPERPKRVDVSAVTASSTAWYRQVCC